MKPVLKTPNKTRFNFTALLGLVLAFSLALTGCASEKPIATSTSQSATPPALYKIGITQIVEHPSLDEIRAGIEAGLKDQGFDTANNLEIDYENAQGNMENTQLIAQRFDSQKKNLVIAITTPSAQAAFQAVHSSPVIFSAITDPEGAGLKTKGITGVSDMTPIQKQLDLLKTLLPNANKIGMVYNTSEQNSVVQVKIAEELAAASGLELISVGVSSTNDMAAAIDQVLSKVDVFYAHVDNSLAAAFPLLVQKTEAAQIPIIGAVEKYVTDGALATDGIDNYQIGYQTGLMAAKVLKGAAVDSLPIETIQQTECLISKKTAERFQIEIPVALKGNVVE